ncbi:uncharacterized protein [Amphiura filiformis]|uniref:uncharacterized protein n=1 Tax=Amphiura filiformis TaxID=82378 RepID=UPI003B228933
MATASTENTGAADQISTGFSQLSTPTTTTIHVQSRPEDRDAQANATIATITQISSNFELTDGDAASGSAQQQHEQEARSATMTAADMEMAIMLATIDQKITKLCDSELNNSETKAGYLTGYIEGDGDALEKFLRSYYAVTGTSFVRTSIRLRSQPGTSKRFGQSDGCFRWEARLGDLPIYYFGHPFRVEGTTYMHCQYGPTSDSRGNKKPANHMKNTRKMNCKATILIREILAVKDAAYSVDPSIKIKSAGQMRKEKEKRLKQLRQHLLEGKEFVAHRRFYLRVPLVSSHTVPHPVGSMACVKQTLDRKVANKAKQLIEKNVTDVDELSARLREYVECGLFANQPAEFMPEDNNRKFFPPKKDLNILITTGQRKVKTELKRTIETPEQELHVTNTMITVDQQGVAELAGIAVSSPENTPTPKKRKGLSPQAVLKRKVRVLRQRMKVMDSMLDSINDPDVIEEASKQIQLAIKYLKSPPPKQVSQMETVEVHIHDIQPSEADRMTAVGALEQIAACGWLQDHV